VSNGALADPYDLPFPKMGVTYASRYANGHMSATCDPIHFMFGSRVGFSGTADRTALFLVASNPTAHSIHLYSAHRAVVIFVIAQLS